MRCKHPWSFFSHYNYNISPFYSHYVKGWSYSSYYLKCVWWNFNDLICLFWINGHNAQGHFFGILLGKKGTPLSFLSPSLQTTHVWIHLFCPHENGKVSISYLKACPPLYQIQQQLYILLLLIPSTAINAGEQTPP